MVRGFGRLALRGASGKCQPCFSLPYSLFDNAWFIALAVPRL